MGRAIIGQLVVFAIAASSVAAAAPLVIAHRGASGYLPEHTLEAYAFAYALGVDYIEPDLVLTADGVLIARHEPVLEETTDVAVRFPGRRHDDGHFYAADFAWAEISQLRARERLPGRFPSAGALFGIPRFEEIMALVAGLNAATGCSVGLYPELKWPSWHRERGLPMAGALAGALTAADFDGPLRIQSFETAPLLTLRDEYGIQRSMLVRLLDGRRDQGLLDAEGLQRLGEQAGSIGPSLQLLAGYRERGIDLVAQAHATGLDVHAWTLRADYHPHDGSFANAVLAASSLGVDGLFTDHPDQVLAALDRNKETVACTPIANRAP